MTSSTESYYPAPCPPAPCHTGSLVPQPLPSGTQPPPPGATLPPGRIQMGTPLPADVPPGSHQSFAPPQSPVDPACWRPFGEPGVRLLKPEALSPDAAKSEVRSEEHTAELQSHSFISYAL